MRERADGDEVDAGLGDRADGVERDAAGRLELGAAGDERDGARELGRRHVVEQDPVGAGVERLAHLRRASRTRPRPAGRSPGRGATASAIDAGEPQVVVLDQDAVVEAEAVVRAAAAADRVLLERAQARASSCACRGSSRRCRRPRRRSGASAWRCRRGGRAG